MVNDLPTRNLIPGPTAHALLQWRYKATTLVLIIVGATWLLSVSGVPQSWFTNMMLGCMLLSVLPLCVLIIRVPSRVRAEKRAGYTTLQYGDKELEQRDPYLGRIIRHPGQDFLQREEFMTAIQAAKAEAEKDV